MRTTLEIILGLFGALAISSGFVLLAILAFCCLFAGGCWYGLRRVRGRRRADDAEREVKR